MLWVFNLPLFVCVFQGWVMAVRWLFYTPVSIILWYWPGRFSISSSLLTLNFPGRVAETSGTQVCCLTKWTCLKGSTCSDSGVHAVFSCCKQFTLQTTSQGVQIRLGLHFKRCITHTSTLCLKTWRLTCIHKCVWCIYVCVCSVTLTFFFFFNYFCKMSLFLCIRDLCGVWREWRLF